MPAERKRQPVGDGTEDWHGKPGGYGYHRCGCDACVAVHAEAWLVYRRSSRPELQDRESIEALIAAEREGGQRRMRPEDSARLRGGFLEQLVTSIARTSPAFSPAEPEPEAPVKHRRHWCLHCGCTIEPLERETRIAGRGPYTGQWRYFHADQAECAEASRRAAKQQSKFVSGGLVRGKK